MAEPLPKTNFLNALHPPSVEDLSSTLRALKRISASLAKSSGTISIFNEKGLEPILKSMTDFIHRTNEMESSLQSNSAQLAWLASKFVKILKLIKENKEFAPKMQGYLERKLKVFTPKDYLATIHELGDNLSAVIAIIDELSNTATGQLTKMEAAVKEGKRQIKETASAEKTANILRTVGVFIGTLSEAAATLAAASEKAKGKIKDDIKDNPMPIDDVDDEEIVPEDPRKDRLNRSTKAAAIFVAGNGISKGIEGIFNLAADLVKLDGPTVDINTLSTMITKLQTYTIPLYRNHIIPSLETLKTIVRDAGKELSTVTVKWLSLNYDLANARANFFVWKNSEDFSESDFNSKMDSLINLWTNLSETDLSNLSVSSLALNAIAAPGHQQLVDLISVGSKVLSDPFVALKQTTASLGLKFNGAIDYLGGEDDDDQSRVNAITLSKNINQLSVSMNSITTETQYFAEKLESLLSTGKFASRSKDSLGYMLRKLRVVSDSTTDTINELSGILNSTTELSGNLESLLKEEEISLKQAIDDFNHQKQEIQKIVDEQKRYQQSQSQRISSSFKGMMKKGLFSKATLKLIVAILGFDITDTEALDQAQTSIDKINSLIEAAKKDKEAKKSAHLSLVGAGSDIGSLNATLMKVKSFFDRKLKDFEVAEQLDESLIDWKEFDKQIPNIISSWKEFYNRLIISKPSKMAIGAAPYPNALAWSTIRASYSTGWNSFVNSLADVAPSSPERERVKNALAPAKEGTEAVVKIVDEIKTIRTALDTMTDQLSTSTYSQSLLTKVTEFKKKFNDLEVQAKILATKIYWFADKNIKVLSVFKQQAAADSLTVTEFQEKIAYLQRKVDIFLSASTSMALAHKNLKSDMELILSALKSTKDFLTTEVPKMKKKLEDAQSDLKKEKEKERKAAIVKAVGSALSTLGQGGAIFAVASGNAIAAGFAAAGMIIGGIMNLVGGLIGGDATKMQELQASITLLEAQIPEFEKCLSAMDPSIEHANVIIGSLDKLTASWQKVSNDLTYVNQDYKSWLLKDFDIDDFTFDVDDNRKKWNSVRSVLIGFADDLPPESMIHQYTRPTAIAADLGSLIKGAEITNNFGNLVLNGKGIKEENFKKWLAEVQPIAKAASKACREMAVQTRNSMTDLDRKFRELNRTKDQIQNEMKKLQQAIDKERHKSFWDKLGDTFKSFLKNPITILGGPTVIVIKSLTDAIKAQRILADALTNLLNKMRMVQQEQKEVKAHMDSVNKLIDVTTKLSNSVVKLSLDTDAKVIYNDWQFDIKDTMKTASEVVQYSKPILSNREKSLATIQPEASVKPVPRGGLKADNKAEEEPAFLCGLPPHISQEAYHPAGPTPEGGFGLIINNSNKWTIGTTITWSYIEPPPYPGDNEIIQDAFKEWEKYVNLKFQQKADNDYSSMVRIGFRKGGSWSYLGTDILNDNYSWDRTMNFGWELAKQPLTAAHEIGHTLGFPHEHQNPNSGLIWDEDEVYAWAKSTQGWDEDVTYHNILRPLSKATVEGSAWDPKSLMHYPFPSYLIKGPSPYNEEGIAAPRTFSEKDKTWARKFYPFNGDDNFRNLHATEVSRSVPLESNKVHQLNITPDKSGYYALHSSDCNIVVFKKTESGLKKVIGKELRNLTALNSYFTKGIEYIVNIRPHGNETHFRFSKS